MKVTKVESPLGSSSQTDIITRKYVPLVIISFGGEGVELDILNPGTIHIGVIPFPIPGSMVVRGTNGREREVLNTLGRNIMLALGDKMASDFKYELKKGEVAELKLRTTDSTCLFTISN